MSPLARAPRRRPAPRALLLALLWLLASPLPAAAARPAQGKGVRPNAPASDPYTRGEPEALARAGILSLGGFEFGKTDTADVDAWLATNDIKWIETEHIELGFALGSYKVKQEEQKRITAELTELATKLPTIDPRVKVLDPWLRAHMYARRAEAVYSHFLRIAGVEDSVFPRANQRPGIGGTYWGEGPYLGQKGKYEVLILPSEAASVSFLTKYFGLGIKRTQRWNVVERDSLIVVMHTQQGRLVDDGALHGHLAFNLAHNFLDGFKHYSYDLPIWLREGLAHFMERSIDPQHNSFDGSEGSVPEMTRKWKWEPEVKRLVQGGDAPSIAELVRYKDFGELGLADHYATWSMLHFLATARPEGLTGLIGGLKGRRNEQGLPDGGNLADVHRSLFREVLGMSYMQFDEAWREWVKASY